MRGYSTSHLVREMYLQDRLVGLETRRQPREWQTLASYLLLMPIAHGAAYNRIGGLVLGARLESGRSRYEPGLRWVLSGSSHTSDLNIGIPVAPLPGAWCYRATPGTGRPGVSIL